MTGIRAAQSRALERAIARINSGAAMIADAGGGDVGVAEPLLYLGDVGLVVVRRTEKCTVSVIADAAAIRRSVLGDVIAANLDRRRLRASELARINRKAPRRS